MRYFILEFDIILHQFLNTEFTNVIYLDIIYNVIKTGLIVSTETMYVLLYY